MIVLGKSNDDKGTQLEKLTQKILEDMGYQNIVKSEISSGGAEIDVSAVFVVPTPGGSHNQKLICECKALQAPTNMTDWMKFLGKVYYAEVERHEEVLGCFICLSGINGNVAGSYESYHLQKKNVTIKNGADILQMIGRQFYLCDDQFATNKIREFTDRAVKSLDVAYYEKTLYWLVVFDKSDYSILSANGDPLIGEQREFISSLVEASTAAHLYIDLFAEAQAQQAMIALEKDILRVMMTRNGSLPAAIPPGHQDQNTGPLQVDLSGATALNDFNRIMHPLHQRGWIENCHAEQKIKLRTDADGLCVDFVEILRFMLTGQVDVKIIRDFIGCEYYDKHINQNLINTIQHIQGDLPLTEKQATELITLLKLSPSALLNATIPLEIIVNHRLSDPPVINEDLDRTDIDSLFNMMYTYLVRDFSTRALHAYFYKVRGIREVENYQRVRVKTRASILLEGEISERLGLVIIAPNFGDTFVSVRALSNTAEPWDGIDPDVASIDEVYRKFYTFHGTEAPAPPAEPDVEENA